jgi:ArsR family transcriptional regulator, arsenate/arsenite/antimonite-responsive transcriptional repressor
MPNQSLPPLAAGLCCAPLVTESASPAEAAAAAQAFQALADPVRLRLLSLIGTPPEACASAS